MAESPKQPYIGRFAPSPTGQLHAGSLLAAVASFLDARANNGKWLLRIEDLDPPREESGADKKIIESLKQHGLFWDDEIVWQSQRHDLYQQALETLVNNKNVFRCSCSRQQLAENGGNHLGDCVYQSGEFAWRFLCFSEDVTFNDRFFGKQQLKLAEHGGDFVVKRKDGLFAYQLAVVVDDYLQGITDVVRGNDLLDSSFRQILLQQALAYPTPNYCHLPVLVDQQGQKLSKQSHAPVIDNNHATSNLLLTLAQLGQPLPEKNQQQNCEQILEWAIRHWSLDLLPHRNSIPAGQN